MSQLKAQLRRDGFTFKQFFVAHDRCAMKVGTDGILLGAWAPVAGVKRILDIGTGSGLVALMLAQRTEEHVTIDAVELDAQAAEQASENVAESPWASRMRVECADILAWAPEQTARYDLIVSNPPYYEPGVECGSPEREQARYTSSLDHKALLTSGRTDLRRGVFLRGPAGEYGQHVHRYRAGDRLDVTSAYRYFRYGRTAAAPRAAGALAKRG